MMNKSYSRDPHSLPLCLSASLPISSPAFTRREFLGSMAVVSAAATVPMFIERSAFALAPAAGAAVKDRAGVPDDRILVVVQLTGGNDGLNAVPPYGSREYNIARPMLGIKEKEAIKLGDNNGIGLHPELVDLKAMMDDGLASAILGVGYPNPNRSHFSSMDIWHTSDPTGRNSKGLGWLGRTMDEVRASNGGTIDATACVCIGNDSPLAAEGKMVKPIAFEKANLFRWSGTQLHSALAAPYDQFNRGDVPAGASDQASFIVRTAMDAQIASDKIRAAVSRGTTTSFPGGRLSDQLRMVASMIRADLPTRVYYVTLGSFDTHSNQAFQQGRLLREFAAAVRAFYKELDALGQRQRVLTMAFSEFGRRVAQNASNGTDHGTAGPMFLFGDMIRTSRTGLLGDQPSLADDKLDQGDLVYNADFRGIYAAILEEWMRVDSKKVLGANFKRANILAVKKTA